MEYKISKELLSEVLEEDVKQIVFDLKTIHQKIRNDVKESEFVAYYNEKWNVLNIYEVAFKNLKEWAYENNYDIRSYIGKYSDSNSLYGSALITSTDVNLPNHRGFICSSEPEAIVKACDYILKELSNK